MPELSFQVRFKSPNSLDRLAFPVEVRRPNLALAARSLTNKPIQVDAGLYLVTVRLPAGQELSNMIQVETGKENVAILEMEEAEESPRESQAEQHYLVSDLNTAHKASQWLQNMKTEFAGDSGQVKELLKDRFEVPKGDFSNKIFLDIQSELLLQSNLKFFDRRTKNFTDSPGLQLRRFAGNILSEKVYLKDSTQWFAQSTGVGTIEISAPGADQLQIVQLIQPETPALNMTLPVFGNEKCRMVIMRLPGDKYTVDIHLENQMANILLRYSNKGYLQQAVEMSKAVAAEDLLFGKRRDPIGAAIGAYALLRFQSLNKLHDWTENLRNWFEWLPDGSAIRGEHLAREGKHGEALEAFLELKTRGCPIFSAGLSYATDRLHLYVRLQRKEFAQDKIKQARRLLRKLQRIAAYTDFREPLTTFTGINLNKPSDQKATSSRKYPRSLKIADYFITEKTTDTRIAGE